MGVHIDKCIKVLSGLLVLFTTIQEYNIENIIIFGGIVARDIILLTRSSQALLTEGVETR